MKKIGLYSFVFLFLLTFSAKSQFWFLGQNGKKAQVLAPFKAYSSVSFGAGSANYWGEIVPISTFTTLATQTTRWNAGFQYTRHFSRKFSAKGSISYIRIAGDDNYFNYTAPGNLFDANFERNLHFRNDLKEISLSGIWEINSNFENPDRRPDWAPYFTLGLAGILHSPEARKAVEISQISTLSGPVTQVTQQDWTPLRTEKTEAKEYSAMAISIPIGFGIRKRLTKNIDIGFEVSYRISMTDYLDDVSDNRAINRSGSLLWNRGINYSKSPLPASQNEQFAANTMAALPPFGTFTSASILSETPGADQYFTTQIQFIYHIKNKIDCPPLPR
jgi:hypothetical protein